MCFYSPDSRIQRLLLPGTQCKQRRSSSFFGQIDSDQMEDPMRILKVAIIIVSLTMWCSSCGSSESRDIAASRGPSGLATKDSANHTPATAEPAAQSRAGMTDVSASKGDAVMQPVSLKQADQSETIAQAVERKIIKDGELTLEVASPAEMQRQVTSIAEANSGYVVTSESKQRESNDGKPPLLDITLVLRVPAARFGPVYDQVQALSKTITQQKTTGQDVTEEFIDLEAHIKTQKALEAQFLEIMKRAGKIEDALEVQRQIAGVRAEIEKLEGRKRFLENRSSLSTITVNLKSPGPGLVVNTSGFGRSVKDAISESVEVGGAIVLFLIRFVIVMIPLTLFVFLPVGLVGRYFARRARRYKLAREMIDPTPNAAQSA